MSNQPNSHTGNLVLEIGQTVFLNFNCTVPTFANPINCKFFVLIKFVKIDRPFVIYLNLIFL